jgi:hypothetical protein
MIQNGHPPSGVFNYTFFASAFCCSNHYQSEASFLIRYQRTTGQSVYDFFFLMKCVNQDSFFRLSCLLRNQSTNQRYPFSCRTIHTHYTFSLIPKFGHITIFPLTHTIRWGTKGRVLQVTYISNTAQGLPMAHPAICTLPGISKPALATRITFSSILFFCFFFASWSLLSFPPTLTLSYKRRRSRRKTNDDELMVRLPFSASRSSLALPWLTTTFLHPSSFFRQ